MATRDPPLPLLAAFNRPGEQVHILVERYSYELPFDRKAGRRYFESELALDADESERRVFQRTTPYPRDVTERIYREAEFAWAYYDIDVDARIGVMAFSRSAPCELWQ